MFSIGKDLLIFIIVFFFVMPFMGFITIFLFNNIKNKFTPHNYYYIICFVVGFLEVIAIGVIYIIIHFW